MVRRLSGHTSGMWLGRAAIFAFVALSASHFATAAETAAIGSFRESIEPLLANYCYACHADGEKNGGVAFDAFKSADELIADRQLWARVLKNVRAGIMPPAGEERPSAEQLRTLAHWVKHEALGIDPGNPDPGRVTVRRLNREEYRNTIRDLMGIDFKAFEEFPPDDTGYGFDNIGDVLSVSPLLLEKYLQAAESIVTTAVPTVSKVIREHTITGRDFRDADGKRFEQLSFYNKATVTESFAAPAPGDYRIHVRMFVRGAFESDPGRANVSFKLGEQEKWKQELAWDDNKRVEFQLDEQLQHGQHQVVIDLEPLTPPEEKKSSVDLRIDSVRVEGPLARDQWVRPKNFERFFTQDAPAGADERRAYAREALSRFTRRAFRRPVDERTIDKLVAIAEEAYNQPDKSFEYGVSRAMVAVLASPRFLFRIEGDLAGEEKSSFVPVDEYALATRLSYFLWSTMPDDELFALAERGELRANLPAQLKRMLADSRADALVENFTGQWLQTRDVEGIQIDSREVVRRDLDPNSEEFKQMESFRRRFQNNNNNQLPAGRRGRGRGAGAGKEAIGDRGGRAGTESGKEDAQGAAKADGKSAAEVARQLDAKRPDAVKQDDAAKKDDAKQPAAAKRPQRPMFRGRFFGPRVEFDRDLRLAMRRETEMLFGHVLREDKSVLELIDSNYTFLNERLAQHYGIKDVSGREMRKVELPPDSPRGGVLAHGSVLAVTSNPTRTSPVKRGLFILENIIGSPPPPPPEAVPDLEDSEKEFKDRQPTLREVLEVHRRDPLCSSCHTRMDPLGLALENFNALGMWREKERGQGIDAAGELITGEPFKNVRDLKKIIRDNRRSDYYRCLTEKLLTYALGRGLEDYDVEAVDRIVERLEKEDGRMSALITGIVESAPFQKRRSTAVAQQVSLGGTP
ncbi:MAG TPA: DUF1592 domain-containing protein [Pirellulales bacterium]|jgi:hypothetical protein|nr:DUF1592 domain-containing protein [Pirellulales bacterium]